MSEPLDLEQFRDRLTWAITVEGLDWASILNRQVLALLRGYEGATARAEVLEEMFDRHLASLRSALPDAEPDWEPQELVAEVERLRAELEPLRTLRRELMAILLYTDEDVETSLVVAAEHLRADLARRDQQITAVRALADGGFPAYCNSYAAVQLLRRALGDKPPLPPPNPLLTATVDDAPLVPLDGGAS
jgi:hypothetical protein